MMKHPNAYQKQTSAFTLVELLIVVVIIAILATITVATYNGIQNRARASAASSALSQARKKLELYKVDNGTYPATGSLSSAGITDANDTTYQYTATNNNTNFCLTATNSTISYYLNDTTTQTPTAGGCPGHGVGGVGAITNLVTNPEGVAFDSSTMFAMNATRWFGTGGSGNYANNLSGTTPIGSTYARKTWTVAPSPSSGDTGFDITGYFAVSEGEAYAFSAYLRPSIIKQAQIGLYRKDSNGATLSREYLGSQNIPAGAWTRISTVYTVPAGVGTMHVVFDTSGSLSGGATAWSPGDTLDITGIMITKGSTLYNFADGNSANWVWNGTPNASTSTGPAP